jgi:lambda family phage minor tail protein L
MAVPVSELQKINPSSIIELFTLTLDATLHGSTDVYRFHNGSSPNNNAEVIWAGNNYLRYPIQATGFEQTGKGSLPRPKLIVSNILGTLTAVMQNTNKVTAGVDLNGSKLVRIRTLARYLDAANWSTGTNPFGTPSPTTELPQEIYYLDRKVTENRDVVEWECASAFDLSYGPKAPKRLITRADFPGVGTFIG